MPRHEERGQAAPLMAIAMALAALLALAAARLGAAVSEHARASTAADAAALAGAAGDRAAAEALARANGGALVAFRLVDGDALVSVRVGHSTASARARPRSSGVALVDAASGLALPLAPGAVPATAWSRPHHDHPAIDLPIPTGTPVAAVAGGRAAWVTDAACGLGLSIDVGGGVRFVYCHGSARLVPDGALIAPGQAVLRSGSTGHSTGPHLHLGVFVDGRAVCPQPLLAALAAHRPVPEPRRLPSTGCVR